MRVLAHSEVGSVLLFSLPIPQMSVSGAVSSAGARGSRYEDDQKHCDVLRVVMNPPSLAVLSQGLVLRRTLGDSGSGGSG